jgi:hypothetical protein
MGTVMTPDAWDALRAMNALVVEAQKITTAVLQGQPGGLSDKAGLSALIGLFDGPQQRTAQDLARAALAAHDAAVQEGNGDDTRLKDTVKAGVDRPAAPAAKKPEQSGPTPHSGTAREAPNGDGDKAGVSSPLPSAAVQGSGEWVSDREYWEAPSQLAPVQGKEALGDLARDDIRRRAKALLVRNGWKPGDTPSTHSIIELMTAIGLDVATNPVDRCAYPECGCDHDATCAEAFPVAVETALASPVQEGWRDISTAPHDRWIIVYAEPYDDLPGFVTPCLWHPDGGFCVDELREASRWHELPSPPETRENRT